MVTKLEFAKESCFSVKDAFNMVRGQRACFIPNIGNAGDGLIALGTFHAFRNAGLALPVIPLNEFTEMEPFDVVLYGGGGQLVPPYRDGLILLQRCVSAGKSVILLPHTVAGYEADLRALAGGLHILCRERASFEGLIHGGFPPERLGLGHDMALSIPTGFFAQKVPPTGSGTAFCFRTDAESARSEARPPTNRDISLSWNGDLWHSESFTESVCRSLAEYLLQFENVETDRLHVAILSAMLGRRTYLWNNSYYKNHAVYEYSLRDRYPNVVFKRDIVDGI